MKTSKSTKSLTQPRRGGVGVDGSSRTGRDGSKLDGSKIDNDEVDGDKVRDDEVGKKVQKLLKSKNLFKSKKMTRSDFFILRARLAFTKLR